MRRVAYDEHIAHADWRGEGDSLDLDLPRAAREHEIRSVGTVTVGIQRNVLVEHGTGEGPDAGP
jgi:hypothetical protein